VSNPIDTKRAGKPTPGDDGNAHVPGRYDLPVQCWLELIERQLTRIADTLARLETAAVPTPVPDDSVLLVTQRGLQEVPAGLLDGLAEARRARDAARLAEQSPARGTCAHCGRAVDLDPRGLACRHADLAARVCSGSGAPPVEQRYGTCHACGNTGVPLRPNGALGQHHLPGTNRDCPNAE
jgi:hypothetical protein